MGDGGAPSDKAAGKAYRNSDYLSIESTDINIKDTRKKSRV